MAPEREVGVDPLLERGQTAFLKALDVAAGELVVGEVGERGPAPQRERLAQLPRRLARRGGARLLHELLEAVRVELARGDAQHVATGARQQHILAERLAQLRDVALQRLGGGLRPLLAPELVDQALAPDELVRVQQQDRQQLALPAAADDKRSIAVSDLQRAEDPEVHFAPWGDATTPLGACP